MTRKPAMRCSIVGVRVGTCAALLFVAVALVACGDDSSTEATAIQSDGDRPPEMVSGLEASPGGGSDEIQLEWDASSEADLSHYKVYRSATSGGPYEYITTVGPNGQPGLGRPADGGIRFIDLKRGGLSCYVVAAVDALGNEGPRSAEACGAPVGALEEELSP
jgi:hypothetical protein